MSQGPLIGAPEMVSTGFPVLSSTIRQPAWAVAGVPSVVGRLPTITHQERSATRAVVSPTPPGHAPGNVPASIWAKRPAVPFGATWTIVEPVPCRLLSLLKLLTRTLPAFRFPIVCSTMATPYGLMSPFAGTVEAIVLTWVLEKSGADTLGSPVLIDIPPPLPPPPQEERKTSG